MGKRLTLTAILFVLLGSFVITPQNAKAIIYEVEIENFAYIPARLHINIGDAIEWRNRDTVGHTSTSDDGFWDSGLLQEDQRFTYFFTAEGFYPYHCSPHPWMVDTVVVGNPTAIDDNLPAPEIFELGQNYPNPFNARTSINFSISVPTHVKLSVYNLLGQEIETLVDSNVQPGEHNVIWDAAEAPTGVYFYRIETAEFIATRKMLLAK